MEATKAMHVWTADSEEWVVAESATDACAVYCAFIGCNPSTSVDDADWGTHPDHWSELPDDKILKWAEECPEMHKKGESCSLGCDGEMMLRTSMTCGEHVARTGRSYLGSANY